MKNITQFINESLNINLNKYVKEFKIENDNVKISFDVSIVELFNNVKFNKDAYFGIMYHIKEGRKIRYTNYLHFDKDNNKFDNELLFTEFESSKNLNTIYADEFVNIINKNNKDIKFILNFNSIGKTWSLSKSIMVKVNRNGITFDISFNASDKWYSSGGHNN